jgi:hypothetical protein
VRGWLRWRVPLELRSELGRRRWRPGAVGIALGLERVALQRPVEVRRVMLRISVRRMSGLAMRRMRIAAGSRIAVLRLLIGTLLGLMLMPALELEGPRLLVGLRRPLRRVIASLCR